MQRIIMSLVAVALIAFGVYFNAAQKSGPAEGDGETMMVKE